MKVAIAQVNPIAGDINGNLALMEGVLKQVVEKGADLVVFPEFFITGYPLHGLLERRWFVERAEDAIKAVAKISAGFDVGILLGAVVRSHCGTGRGLYNCAVGFYQGKEVCRQVKSLLRFCDVFDETCYFDPGKEVFLWYFKEERLGVVIGDTGERSRGGDLDLMAEQDRLGATVFVNIAASPFWRGKPGLRYRLITTQSQRYRKPFIFVNQAGAQDELIFDGNSFVVNREGKISEKLGSFAEEVRVVDIADPGAGVQFEIDELGDVYQALVLGVRDYFRKSGFSRAVLGLSGGVDSAVVACIAVAALGRDNVLSVMMPSEFTARESVEDAELLARNLGIKMLTIPITGLFHSYLESLAPLFGNRRWDETEENIQSRIRGNILMAIANKFNCLVLATGNKSELAVGYCTLYGDLSGALAVIGDVPKRMVYEIGRYINREKEVIPARILNKPPSAELRPDQKDTDSLPPYEILDGVLKLYIDDGLSPAEIIERGYDENVVNWVVRQVAKMEYKRRQAPPVLRVTSRFFGSGRRFPITARYI